MLISNCMCRPYIDTNNPQVSCQYSYNLMLTSNCMCRPYIDTNKCGLCIGECPSNSPFLKNNGAEAHWF